MEGGINITELTQLPGVGSSIESKLKDAGYNSVEDLEGLSIESLMEEIGLTELKATTIIKAIQRILGKYKFDGRKTAARNKRNNYLHKLMKEKEVPTEKELRGIFW